LDWRAKVEFYEQIRREYEFGTGSILAPAVALIDSILESDRAGTSQAAAHGAADL